MEKDDFLLTIAIPTLNREMMLKECLNKIISQDNGKIEIIISDNGSTDNTQKMCEEYCAKYTYIKYFRNEKNEGFDYNFRNCIVKSSGKYVHVLSDDDIISDNFILELFKILDSKNVDLIALNLKGFALSSADINEYDNKGFVFKRNHDKYYDSRNIDELFNDISYWFTLVSMFIMKRELVQNLDDDIFEKYRGTWFMNVVHNLLCISKGKQFVFASNCFLNIRTMNYAHYNIYDVFFNQFKFVLYGCSNDFGLKKSLVKKCYKKLLKEHMPSFEYLMKIKVIDTFKRKPKWKYAIKAFTYINFWIYFFPIVLCPKSILMNHYRRRNK